jgi:hypothetical protein
MTKRHMGAVSVLMTMLILPVRIYAQSSNTSLGGTITDAYSGVLPGVNIKAINSLTGVVTSTTANTAGTYTFASLQPGTYKITAEFAGFQTRIYTDVLLRGSTQVRLDIQLELVDLEEPVKISIPTDNLFLESGSSVGPVLPENTVNKLPLVNNNALDLIRVIGGTVMTDQNPILDANDTVMAGVSTGNVNLTKDGVSLNEVRYNSGLNSALRLNNEIVAEFKVLLSPVDAGIGRGNGQIQLLTKSGTNNYHGSAVWSTQNTALDSNQFYLNKTNTAPDWRNVNEYTVSLGGPIIKNKTFFFVMWDQQLASQRRTVNSQVLTSCARKGIFRYFDNWVSGNINTPETHSFSSPTIPVVNADGNIITPKHNPDGSAYNGRLHLVSVFGKLRPGSITDSVDCSDYDPTTDLISETAWDKYRTQPDPSGYISRFTDMMPAANNYEIGDGLNVAGHKFTLGYNGSDNLFGMGEDNLRKQVSVKIDHSFNARHRLSGNYSFERDDAADNLQTWPNGYGGAIARRPQMLLLNLASSINSALLNEFRFGMMRSASTTYDPLDNPSTGSSLRAQLKQLLPTESFSKYKDMPILVSPGSGDVGFQMDVLSTDAISSGINASNPVGSRGNLAPTVGGHDPRWTYADTMSWTKGRHSFKSGAEVRTAKSYQERTGTGDANTYVEAVGGAAQYAQVQGINSINMQGIVGSSGNGSIGTMEGLLNYMSGSLSSTRQFLYVNSPGASSWNSYSNGQSKQVFDIRMKEFSLFFKDDWKVNNGLTLNLGLRYEYYGVPYLNSGMTVGLQGGSNAIFGVTGGDLQTWMVPNRAYDSTQLTKQIFIGPNSPNPHQQAYNDDWKNLGPAVGFAWQLPWFGKGETTFRGGWQISYLPMGRADDFANVLGSTVGTSFVNTYSGTSANPYLDIAHLSSYTPVPIPTAALPLSTLPMTDRTQSITVFDQNLRNPYVHNLTLALVRNVGKNVTLDVRYVGTFTRDSLGTINLNTPNYIKNGLLSAFNAARAGGESDLLNQMFRGINIQGPSGCGPVGSVCNGVLQTGAAQLRNSKMVNGSSISFRTMLANGNYVGLANALAVANYNKAYPGNQSLPAIATGINGALLRQTGMPENFIYANPQFAEANLIGNYNFSNYNSMQAQITIRPVAGFSFVGTYTWSRDLGLNGTYTDPTDRNADYGLLNSNRSHQFIAYGSWDLPFGKRRPLLKNVPKSIDMLIGGWQMSWIGNWNSGSPASIVGNTTMYANGAVDFVGQAGSFDTKLGQVFWAPREFDGNYFGGKYVKVRDPQCSSIASGLQDSCALAAIAPASNPSAIVFQNAQPGTRGNFGLNNITNPGLWNADAALSKAFRVAEGKSLSIRIDASNVFNHPTPSFGYSVVSTRMSIAAAPNYTLNPSAYGNDYPFGYIDNKVGARSFQAKIRFVF